MVKYKLALCAIFKNESHIFNEWLEHYINQGVEKFYLIDNGSTDDYMKEIQRFMDKITLFRDEKRYAQVEHYKRYVLPLCKQEAEWLLVCDLDEFIYARKSFKTITEYLQTLPDDVSAVRVPWKMFGSSGYKDQPKRVVRSFLMRDSVRDKWYFGAVYKCIVRTSKLINIEIHCHSINGGTYIDPDNKPVKDPQNIPLITEQELEGYYLHNNHYRLQSFNWFMKVKVPRGDATDQQRNSERNERYFYEQDSLCNSIYDDELKRINEKIDSNYPE
jgi:hypothetical protein